MNVHSCEMHLMTEGEGAIYVHCNDNQPSIDFSKTGFCVNVRISKKDCAKLAEMLMNVVESEL